MSLAAAPSPRESAYMQLCARNQIGRMLLVAAAAFALLGCRQDGPARYSVSGEVKYGGAPVAAGQVIFEPDGAQGNAGPAGYAEIHDGYFETIDGKGIIGGPHQIRVICLSGKASSELPQGAMLCPEFQVTADLPQRNSEHNIEVPGTLKW